MADIPEEKIAEVRDRLDIVEVIGRSVALKQAGRSWKGLCPFHQEKTPSFHVDPRRKLYHCFGCRAGGDVFRFVMDYEGRSFPEVVRALAEEVGVALPEPQRARDPREDEARRKRDLLRDANERASAVFSEWLERSPAAETGRRYLQERGIGPEMVELFGLGFAPLRNDLGERLVRAGVPERVIEGAGLLARGDRGLYERFRGRVMVPIRDQDGRAIAFGARLVEGDHPAKYLNSPETLIYRKSTTLFGLSEARPHIRREEASIVVEGYFDVIALVQAGIRHVVATCGTALTKEHCRLLARHARDVYLVFDGDEAGSEAAARTHQVVGDVPGLTVKVVSLPKGEDPDTFVRKKGPEAFLQACRGALPLTEVLIDRALQGVGRAIEDRVRAVDRVAPYLEGISDSLSRRLYLQKVADRLGLDERTLARRLAGRGRKGADHAGPVRSRSPEEVERAAPPADEEALCLMLLEQPALAEGLDLASQLSLVSDDRCRQLLSSLLESWCRSGDPDVGAILEEITDPVVRARWRGHIAGLCEISSDFSSEQERLLEARRKLDLVLGRLARQVESRRRRALASQTAGISDPVQRARMIQESRGRSPRGACKQ